ncbi:TPA: ROK family protein [Streptococcus suis]
MKHYLSIDIGGTFVKYAFLSEHGDLLEQSKSPTPATKEDFLALLEEVISQYRSRISGVGLACPGSIQTKTGYVRSGGLIPYLKAVPLGAYLTEFSGLPVTVLNDADAAGLAEAKSGNLNQVHYGAALVLGTGVGLSVVSDGNLLSLPQLQGQDFLTRPLSHVQEREGANLMQALGQVLDLHWRGIKSLVANSGSAVQFIGRASQQLGLKEDNGQEVFEQLSFGQDADLRVLFEQYCREIAYLILNLRLLFQLDKVVIGGGISQQDLLIEQIRLAYQEVVTEEDTPVVFRNSPSIEGCRFHNEANLLGALYFHIQETA